MVRQGVQGAGHDGTAGPWEGLRWGVGGASMGAFVGWGVGMGLHVWHLIKLGERLGHYTSQVLLHTSVPLQHAGLGAGQRAQALV